MSKPFPEGAPSPGPSAGESEPGGFPPGAPGSLPGPAGAKGRSDWLRPGPRTLNLLRLLLTFATLGMLAWYLHSRPRTDWSVLDLRWDRLALACACLPLLLYMRALKWKLLLRGQAPAVTLGESLRSYLGSMALALVTPGRVGELTRGMYLPHKAVQGLKGAGLVMIDSWTDLLAVLGWACLGWAVFMGPAGLALGLFLFAVAAPIPFWLALSAKVTLKLPMPRVLRDWTVRCLPGPRDIPGGDLRKAILLGLAAYGVEWLQLLLLLQGLAPLEAEAWRVAGVMALVALSNSVQVTLAGLGIREGMSMMLLANLGIPPEAAVMAAFLQSALLLFLPALAGLAVKPVALQDGPTPRSASRDPAPGD